MWINRNENPDGRQVGDCTVRAISAATGDGWDKTYFGLCGYGAIMKDMPSSNAVWGAYLKSKGFKRGFISDACSERYTVSDFCDEHKTGIYILALSSHVICVVDGHYIDTWDSGKEIPIYYWYKEHNQ